MVLKNPKAKGSRLELKAKAEIESTGYYCVKSGGSFGLFDLLCTPYSSKSMGLAVQVKANRKPSRKEMKAMAEMRLPDDYCKQVWIWHDRKGWEKITVI